MFDALDERWWRAGSSLNWWDCALAEPPSWLPAPEPARAWLMRHPKPLTAALALIRSHRTCETSQLNALDPRLPGDARARLWMSMAACRLIDLGFPLRVDGRTAFGPHTAWMGVRLPVHREISPELPRLGLSAVEIADIGPGPLRGARQYDRHNLIATGLAVKARSDGWLTAGEAWCRFDRICADPLMGGGGPDLALIGERDLVCVELTASMGQTLEDKFRRWDRVLAHRACDRVSVVWLAAGRGPDNREILKRLGGLCDGRPRQHAADAADWMGRIACVDGWEPEPGSPVADDAWMRRDMTRLGRVYGMPAAGDWRLPERLAGRWIG